MTHKIINTGDYLLIVDESEIKEGDWIIGEFAFNGTIIRKNVKHYGSNKTINNDYWTYSGETHQQLSNAKKIIAHLPLNNSQILEGIDLLPPLEDDINKIAREYEIATGGFPISFKAGYNKAKDKYKYTEEDLKECVMYILRDLNAHNEVDKPVNFVWVDSFEKYIQSLQQPKMPVGFKCEVDYVPSTFNTWKKTTTNSQGITQWVGEYIY